MNSGFEQLWLQTFAETPEHLAKQGISYHYLHERPANEDYSLVAKGYFLIDLTANYTKKHYEIGLSIENLFNTVWYESQVEYVSKLKYETAPIDEVSYTAGVPFFAKLKLSVFF